MTGPVTLVVGSGGLLGSRLVIAAGRRAIPVMVCAVRWGVPASARADLAAAVDRLLESASGAPWRVAWCAGVGVTNTIQEALDRELDTLRAFLDVLGERSSDGPHGPGSIFLASSAGGVYAGAADPPFTERTTPQPLSAYGQAKLAAEAAVRDASVRWGIGAFIGRIANLYGPGQDLRKPQGLITHLCRTHMTGQPLRVYVSLDTLRDYLFVDDCAEMVLDGLTMLDDERGRRGGSGAVVTKILASQRSVSVGALLSESTRVFHRAARVLVAESPNARVQARDLRLRSVVWPELDRRSLMPLPAGIAATARDVRQRVGRADFV